MLSSSPFFASYSAAALIQSTLQSAQFVRIATAYFEASGYQVLQDVLGAKRVHLLIGREEGGRDRLEAVLEDFIERFLARPLDRRTQAVRQMLSALENNLLYVAVGDSAAANLGTLLDARYLYQHAKLYLADETAAVVTSANFSHHGLVRSIEAGIRVTEASDVAYFVQQFDQYFERAESITDALIERLRQLLSAYLPYQVYARTLLELYELPDDEVPTQLPPGFRSALRISSGSQLFLLVRCRRRLYALLFDQEGQITLDTEQRDQIIQRIRCSPNTPIALHMPDDNAFDQWIDAGRASWCRQHGYSEDEVQVICALALVGA